MRKTRVLRKQWAVVLLAAILSPLFGAALVDDGELALPRDFQNNHFRPVSGPDGFLSEPTSAAGSVLSARPFTAAGGESSTCAFGCISKDDCPAGWNCCSGGICLPVCGG